MGGTSSLDHMTRQFESGMLRPALQLESPWRGTLTGCCQLLPLPMGGTSSLDLKTRQFESGMPRLALQSASLWNGTLALWRPLQPLPMRSTSFLDPVAGLFTHGTHFHKFPLGLPGPSRLNGRTKRVGSETQVAVYSIGCPMTVVQAYIYLLSSQFFSHLLFGQFLFVLMSLHLESLGPKSLALHRPNVSLFLTLCLLFAILATRARARLQFLLRILTLSCHVLPDSVISSIYNGTHI